MRVEKYQKGILWKEKKLLVQMFPWVQFLREEIWLDHESQL